jgi:hypothetical protein
MAFSNVHYVSIYQTVTSLTYVFVLLAFRPLEKELLRKDKALAETAALLVLKKKVQEIWGDGDDNTSAKNGH